MYKFIIYLEHKIRYFFWVTEKTKVYQETRKDEHEKYSLKKKIRERIYILYVYLTDLLTY